jgi:hypothetical protein
MPATMWLASIWIVQLHARRKSAGLGFEIHLNVWNQLCVADCINEDKLDARLLRVDANYKCCVDNALQ